MMQLKNRSIIITGASSGIGEATAKVLAEAGANVALAARRKDQLDSLKDDIEAEGGNAIAVKTDVTERDQAKNLANKTKEAFGSIDVLVNCAGVMPLSYMKKLHVDEWEQMIDVNLKGVLFNIAAVLPTMVEQQSGHIVNISSVDGRRVYPGGAVYCATKFGVSALSEGLRQEVSTNDHIRVTTIEPGTVDTELTDSITDKDIRESLEEEHQDINLLKSEDIASSIKYALTQPDRVDVSEVLVMPTEQS